MATGPVLYQTSGRLVTPTIGDGPSRGDALGRLRTVREAALLVEADRIVAVGKAATLRAEHRDADRVDFGDALIVPGFVDAHNHLPFLGSRAVELDLKLEGASYLDILGQGGGIHRTVRATRSGSKKDLVEACLGRLDLMLTTGTTTAEAKSGYGLRWKDEEKQLRAVRDADAKHAIRLVPTFLGAHVVPNEVEREEYVAAVADEMIPAVARGKLARFCDVFYEKNAFNRAETRRVLTAAREHGLATKLHADEFSDRRGAALGVGLGCTSVDHLMHVGADGIKRLAGSETVAVLLPLVHRATFEERPAPARSLVTAGAAVALGTDFNPNCHNPSMLDAFRAAVYDLRLTPAEALTAATKNAACALGEGDEAGVLAKGYRADFLVVDAADPTDLAYRQGENPIRKVIVGGVPSSPTRPGRRR